MPSELAETETAPDPVLALIKTASIGIEGVRKNLARALKQRPLGKFSRVLLDTLVDAAELGKRIADIESAVRHDAEKED